MYNKKSTWTITGLRKLFKEFRGQLETGQTSAIASALLCGKALCVCCWQHNKKSGLLSLRRDTLNEHINHPQHKAHMARLATVGIQLDIFEAGGAQLDSREAQLATLVGVPMGAAGIPPSSLPSVMSKEGGRRGEKRKKGKKKGRKAGVYLENFPGAAPPNPA